MKHCRNCDKTHGPLKRYMWNTRTNKGLIAESNEDLLCERCAKSLGAWETVKQEDIVVVEIHVTPKLNEEEQQFFDDINSITIGTPEEAARVAMSLTDEDIERLEREEKYSSLN